MKLSTAMEHALELAKTDGGLVNREFSVRTPKGEGYTEKVERHWVPLHSSTIVGLAPAEARRTNDRTVVALLKRGLLVAKDEDTVLHPDIYDPKTLKLRGKPVLLSRHHKAVLEFLSKDETRPILAAAHLTTEHIEATDSYRLVRITHGDYRPAADDFPRVDGDLAVGDVPLGRGINLAGKALAKAFGDIPTKHTLPILNRIAVKPGEHTVALTTTDLEQTTVRHARLVEGSFPDYDKLIDGLPAPRATISLNPTFLTGIAKAFQTFGATNAHPITLAISSPLKPMKFTATNDQGMTMTAILMPVRNVDTPDTEEPSDIDVAAELISGKNREGIRELITKAIEKDGKPRSVERLTDARIADIAADLIALIGREGGEQS